MIKFPNVIFSSAAKNAILFKAHRQLNHSSPFDLDTTSQNGMGERRKSIEDLLTEIEIEKTIIATPVKKAAVKNNLFDDIAPAKPVSTYITTKEKKKTPLEQYKSIIEFIKSINFPNSTQYFIEKRLIQEFNKSDWHHSDWHFFINFISRRPIGEAFPEIFFPDERICIRVLLGANPTWAKSVIQWYINSDQIDYLIILSGEALTGFTNTFAKHYAIIPYNIN